MNVSSFKTNFDFAKLENKLVISYEEQDALKRELVYKDEDISCLNQEISCLNQELKYIRNKTLS